MTGRFEKVAVIRNEIEALALKAELEDRGVPHVIQSYYDLAYDGLFQASRGWGCVEAPAENRQEVLEFLDSLREQATSTDEETDEP